MNAKEDFRDKSTVAIKVRFMGDLPSVVGERETTVSLPPASTVGDLLRSLCDHYGEPFRCRVVSQPGKLHHTILIFLNGENIKEIGDLAAKVAGNLELEIVMLPMFEGG